MDFSGVRVLCIGDLMVDRYLVGQVDRISPEAPVPVLHLKESRGLLGGAANVARNIAALGGEVVLVGLVGADQAGGEFKALLQESHGIVDATVQTSLRPTTCKSRVVALHQQVIRIDQELVFPARPAEVSDMRQAVDAWIGTVDAVILSDYGKGVLSPEVAGYILACARARGIPTFVDPKSKDFSLYSGATCITPNLKELAAAVGYMPRTEDQIAEAGRKVLAAANADALLVTRSEDGMTLITAEGQVSTVPAKGLEVFDVTGAGDTAIAMFALACIQGQDMSSAMRIANIAAGIVVGKSGSATLTRDELNRALQEETETAPTLASRRPTLKLVKQWKRAGLRVGFTNGCFDILHAGHVSLLRQARAQCDRLVVGLNTDASVSRLKGPERPLNALEDRASVLLGLRFVDAVVPFHEDTPRALIEELQPHVLVKGSDYTMGGVVGADIVQQNGGSVVLVDLVAERSTTKLISRIRQSA